jgi:hypothetical protein
MVHFPTSTRMITTALVLLSVLAASFGFHSPIANAQSATMYPWPTSGSHKIGETFTVNILVSSPDAAMNAVSGTITFPTDKLEVVGLSKGGSIISLWVQEPSYSNASGSVSFEGVVLNPGFQGTGGQIIGVQVRGKSAGEARFELASGAVLANDGSGTNILSGLGAAKFTITSEVAPPPRPIEAEPVEEEEEAEAPALPAPVITSPTHPDPDAWYANNDPCFEWVLQENVTAVAVQPTRDPETTPSGGTPGLFGKCYTDFGDGTWYLHLRFQTSEGLGPIEHFPFHIDTVAPNEFEVIADPDGDEADFRPSVFAEAEDAASGIDHYEIGYLDSTTVITVPADEMLADAPPRLPFRVPGTYTVFVRAFDAAGNFTEGTAEITITAFAAPTITDYAEELVYGDSFWVQGQTYPFAIVYVNVLNDRGTTSTFKAAADEDGNFDFNVARRFRPGVYTVTVSADVQGVQVGPSEAKRFTVAPSLALQLEDLSRALMTIVIAAGVLVALLIGALILLWRSSLRTRRAVMVAAKRSENDYKKAFLKLRKDVVREIHLIEKVKLSRDLSREEHSITSSLKRDLRAAEKIIREDLEEIEKDLL